MPTCRYPDNVVLDSLLNGSLVGLGRVYSRHGKVGQLAGLHWLQCWRYVVDLDAIWDRLGAQYIEISGIEGCQKMSS